MTNVVSHAFSRVRPLIGFIPTDRCGKHEVKKRVDLLLSFIDLSNKVVLDLGCGDGRYEDELIHYDCKLYCLDVDKEAVRRAKKNCPHIVLAACEFLPFVDRPFDLILVNDVLEHVGDDKLVMTELYRCVKENGHIEISVPNRLFPFEVHGIPSRTDVPVPLINYLPDIVRNRLVPHSRAYSAKSISQLLKNVHMKIVCWQYIFPE